MIACLDFKQMRIRALETKAIRRGELLIKSMKEVEFRIFLSSGNRAKMTLFLTAQILTSDRKRKKQPESFSDPIKQEIPVRSEMDSLIGGDKYELRKTYESSIQEMEVELKR